jgi:uncharacterized membrane protein
MALDAAGHRLHHHVRPSSVTAQATAGTSRKAYLDWLRGVAVIVMIQGHVIDSWTLVADKNLTAYRWITFIGGIAGAPLFLFLAGVALALAAASRLEKGRTLPDVAALARRRGWQIFGLAFLFRLQSWLISGGPALKLLKVDILNVMGLSMVAGAVLWALGRRTRTRIAVFVGAAVACAMVTPLVRTTEAIRLLPDPVEWYLIPAAGTTAFTLLPWAGFLFAGAACGVLLEAMRSHAGERSANFGLAVAGVITAAAGYAASFLPAIYEQTNFWTSSPTFFFVRLGLVMALVPVAYVVSAWWAWERMREFGRASLFVYWIHVEIVYGVLTAALHRRLPFEWSYLAFVGFAFLMFAVVKLREPLQNAIRYVIFAINARLNILPVRSSRRSL